MVNILHHLFIAPVQTSRATKRGGQGVTMTPGTMDFRGPLGIRKAVGFSGPSRGSPNFERKKRSIFGEDLFFFFRRSHHISNKTAAFSLCILKFTKPEIRHI